MKWLKAGAVIFGALLITTLGIDAADTYNGSRSTLLGELITAGKEQKTCPNGMVEAPMAQTFKCVDRYEASASPNCPYPDPANILDTTADLTDTQCKATSVADAKPWTYITREQAITACVDEGKRLPTAQEWYMATVGTPDDPAKCNVDSDSVAKTGSNADCSSAIGAEDMIGNVWEWVTDDVVDNKLPDGRALPPSGYVTQVDSQGIATLTSTNAPSVIFYQDFFWSNPEYGAYGMIRGGFYDSKSDAGVYAVHADTLPTTAGTAIGFRCVQ